MIYEFWNSMQCVLPEENSDNNILLNSWLNKNYHIALMPAIFWYGGTYNLFDQKAGAIGKNMIWLVPAGQNEFFWLRQQKHLIEDFYKTDEIEFNNNSFFPGIPTEEFEECILLRSNDLQNNSEHTILGANVLLIRLSLSSGRETILFIILDHQNNCWKNIIEKYKLSLTWFVDSGRGTEDSFTYVKLYQLMKQTPFPELLPSYYFKGLYNKGEIPEGFQFLYAMISHPDIEENEKWRLFSGVYRTRWK